MDNLVSVIGAIENVPLKANESKAIKDLILSVGRQGLARQLANNSKAI